MKRLVIIEDQTAIREMLVEILRLDANYNLAGESGDGQSAVTLCLEVKPDLLVLDAKLPGLNGVDILRRISKKLPNMRVLVFFGHENPVLVREMLEAGAHGFVEKTAGLFEFKKGLETVANGGTYFGPAVAALLRDVVANPASSSTSDFLTDREREILQLVAESHSTKEIAAKLGISVKTVDNGGTYFGPAVAALFRHVVPNPASSSTSDFLTDREREILQLVAESHSTKEIAAK